ncbi:MAG: anti-sigma factor, partial [Myxococcota bacterium]
MVRSSLLSALLLVACGTEGEAVPSQALSLSFQDLPDLGPDYVYEAWVVGDDGPVSAGRFSAQTASEGVFGVNVQGAFKMHITIEPVADASAEWSETHVLYGEFEDGVAELRAFGPAILPPDFREVMGGFTLAAPTDSGAAPENGIWFLDASGSEPAASLRLPTLPEGWIYEGWVVGADGPVSLGTFRD